MAGSIVLIGFMGAGKTTVGRLLAGELGLAFFDTDRAVVEASGRSIAEIWRTDGEEAFRDREHEAVKRACERPGSVIATGGGAVLAHRNLELLRIAGPIVLLEASLDTVEARLAEGATRPMFMNRTHAQREALLAERAVVYDRVCDVSVPTDGRAPDEIVIAIIEALQ